MKALIQTPTPRLESSLDFYTKLGFKQISENPAILSDGKANIEVNTNRFARAGFKFFKKSWDSEIDQLKPFTEVYTTKEGHLFADPCGVWIYLIEGKPEIDFNKGKSSFSILGNYSGISLESVDPQKSVKIYQTLGFEIVFGTLESGFVSLGIDDFTINVMKPNSCPHLFFNPSLTYFNGKSNPEIIAKIRSKHIPITEEITHFNKEGVVDNIIIRDPGGIGFFIFND